MKIRFFDVPAFFWVLAILIQPMPSQAADSLFAPEPKLDALEGSAGSVDGSPLLAEASSDQAANLFRAPGVPAATNESPEATTSASSTSLATNGGLAQEGGTNAVTTSNTVSSPDATGTNASVTVKTTVKDAALSAVAGSGESAAGTPVAPSAPEIPVDAPPNLDQPAEKMAATAVAPPSENVTLNLINRLVQRGILTKEDAGDLIRQAKEDAQNAVQQAQATQQAAQQAAAAQQMAVEAGAPPAADDSVSVSYVPEIVKTEMRDEIKRDVLAAAQSEGWATPNYPSWISNFRPFMDLRTRYQGDNYPGNTAYTDTNVSVLENANLLNFNAINTGIPLNVSQIQGPGSAYGMPGLYPNSVFPIPQGQPGYIAQGQTGYPAYYQKQSPFMNPPTVNNTQQRSRARVRFRFGADMNLGENFTSGFRIGTGQNGNPVSENQSLGAVGSTGQGGDFSSYAIWLDRAFLKYEIGDNPDKMAAITLGRFDNPFYTPTTIMWANDIGFDGVAAQARYKIFKGFTPFITGGIFPVFNSDLNFANRSQPKLSSYDKYLYAGQGGIDWKITKDLNLKGALGYYYFQNVQGQVSAPGVAPNPEATMSTDGSRPLFAQNGNTYVEIRNIKAVSAYPATNPIPDSKQPGPAGAGYIPTPVTNNTTANYFYNPDYQHYVNTGGVYGVQPPYNPSTGYANSGLGYVPPPQYQNQWQYFGLATPYHILSANARLEYRHFEPFVVSLSGEWDQNLAFNQQNIMNNGPTPGPDNNYNYALTPGPINNWQNGQYGSTYQGGNTAWILQAKIGKGALQKRWDWDFGFSYRYVESDSVIDGFCDSDFGGPLAGTNLKGWAIGGNLALTKNVFLGARWFNATTIAGTPINVNTLQLDMNARF
jgi:hypothetical protein